MHVRVREVHTVSFDNERKYILFLIGYMLFHFLKAVNIYSNELYEHRNPFISIHIFPNAYESLARGHEVGFEVFLFIIGITKIVVWSEKGLVSHIDDVKDLHSFWLTLKGRRCANLTTILYLSMY